MLSIKHGMVIKFYSILSIDNVLTRLAFVIKNLFSSEMALSFASINFDSLELTKNKELSPKNNFLSSAYNIVS